MNLYDDHKSGLHMVWPHEECGLCRENKIRTKGKHMSTMQKIREIFPEITETQMGKLCSLLNSTIDKDIERARRKQKLEAFIQDARAFVEEQCAQGTSNDVILMHLAHDIFGLAAHDELMLPRVTGYAKEHGKSKASSGTGIVMVMANKVIRSVRTHG